MKTLLILVFSALPLFGASPSIVTAADNFLATLDAGQKAKSALPFTSDERENFRFTPRERAGLPLKEMTEVQRKAAMALLESAMSEKGMLKINQILILESILAEIEKNPAYRDPGKYCLTIFGIPGEPKGWGWRFEGHHISLNLAFVEGKKIAATPSFLGSNPAEVRDGNHKGLRVLAAEEELARTLVTSLLGSGQSGVVFTDKPPREIITAENRIATALEPVGIPAAGMSESQRTALLTLIAEYTGRYRSEIAAADMEIIKATGIEKIRFGWAGGTKPGEAYYYRIQGPTFLMEAANVQNNANHLHATWRDFAGDFGRDLLREHVAGDH